MVKQRWERAFELTSIGIVIFVGFVSIFYSWIDSIFGGRVNVYLLTVTAALATFLVVYIIYVFDKK